jgi:hypothetical protein
LTLRPVIFSAKQPFSTGFRPIQGTFLLPGLKLGSAQNEYPTWE